MMERSPKEPPIFKFCVLASSSSGNCSFIATDRTRIVIDAGLSRRETFARLAAIGEDPAQIDAIFITHEHSDHIAGLPVMGKTLMRPVFLTHKTAPMIPWGEKIPPVEVFQAGTTVVIGDIEVSSFTIPHDAVDAVGFSFRSQGLKASVATDLGYIPDSVKYHLRDSDLLLLESNHDLEMLKVGPYPWQVKQRVMGRNGHLSNDAAANFIREEMSSRVSTLLLGHLSDHNNYPALVELSASQALEERGLRPKLAVVDGKCNSEVFYY